jgi:hypothetical protein
MKKNAKKQAQSNGFFLPELPVFVTVWDMKPQQNNLFAPAIASLIEPSESGEDPGPRSDAIQQGKPL